MIKDSKGYYAGGFMGILRADEQFIMQSYLASLLATDRYRKLLQLKSTGANIKNLSNEIGALPIPRPPMAVQRKIVVECAELDAECEKRRKEIQKCETKIDALYAEVTKMESNGKGWFEGKLEDILLEPNDLGDKIPESAIQTKGSIPVITQKEGVLVSGYTDKDVKASDDEASGSAISLSYKYSF